MNSKKTKIALKAGMYIAGAYLINTICADYAFKEWALSPEKYDTITSFMKTSSYRCHYQGSDEEKAIKYLKLAHAITMKNMTFQKMRFKDYSEEVNLLEKRIGDCSESSEYTYANYLKLIRTTNLERLAEYVRYASGQVITPDNKKIGHAWLEVKICDRWHAYETTALKVKKDTEIDPDAVPRIISNKFVVNLPSLKYKKELYVQIMPDNKMRSGLLVWNCLKDYEGITGALIRTWLSQN